jgi:hypothetical protein
LIYMFAYLFTQVTDHQADFSNSGLDKGIDGVIQHSLAGYRQEGFLSSGRMGKEAYAFACNR